MGQSIEHLSVWFKTQTNNADGSRTGGSQAACSFQFSWFSGHVFAAFGGRPCSLITPASASNSGSFGTSVASSRCAVAATNASAKEILCAALNFAASSHRASSEWCHWTGNFRRAVLIRAALSAPRSYVRIYRTSVRVTKDAWSSTSPRLPALSKLCTRSKPASLSASVMNAEVSSKNESATRALLPAGFEPGLIVFPVAPPVVQEPLQRTRGAAHHLVQRRLEFRVRHARCGNRPLLCLRRHAVDLLPHHLKFLRRQRFDFFQHRLGFCAHASNHTRIA